MKQKFIDAHLKVAEIYATLSTAKKLQVGSVIVKDDTIIGIGYNGTPPGWDNVCEDHEFKTKSEVSHAEANALAKVTKSTNSSDGATIFITHAPCIECAKLIFQSGIKSVYYRNQYRSTDGIDFLKKCGVPIEKV